MASSTGSTAELWTPAELAAKVDYEGGWWDFYQWGGMTQVTGYAHINYALGMVKKAFKDAEVHIDALNELLPDPSEVDEDEDDE